MHSFGFLCCQGWCEPSVRFHPAKVPRTIGVSGGVLVKHPALKQAAAAAQTQPSQQPPGPPSPAATIATPRSQQHLPGPPLPMPTPRAEGGGQPALRILSWNVNGLNQTKLDVYETADYIRSFDLAPQQKHSVRSLMSSADTANSAL